MPRTKISSEIDLYLCLTTLFCPMYQQAMVQEVHITSHHIQVQMADCGDGDGDGDGDIGTEGGDLRE